MAERLLILDANSILHRVYHALPPLTTKKGELVNAIYGFLLVLFRVIKEFQPDYVCACFDFPAKTFRHEKFKEYKIQRPPCPKDLVSQIPKLKEILEAFKIPIFEKEGYEADDLIGTIVSRCNGLEKIIVSGDLDHLQLVSKNTKVFVLSGVKKSTLYDEKEVEKKYRGLKPQQIPDFKALIGDPSDNIPGIPGIGEKTAIQLLLNFKSLTELYGALKEDIGGVKKIDLKLKQKLLDYENQVFLNRKLAEIEKNVEIDFNINKCQWGKYSNEKIISLLKNLEFHSLIKRLTEIDKVNQNGKIEQSENKGQKLFFKNSMAKKVYLIIVALIVIALVVSYGILTNFKKEIVQDPVLKRIQTRGKILVGTDATYPPMESIDREGNFIGFDIDIAKEIASDLGVKVEFKNIPWERLISFEPLLNDEVDLLISAITITRERSEKVAFSIPYLNAGQVIVTTFENLGAIKGVKDLSDKKVGVQLNTTSEEEAKKYSNSVVSFEDYTKAKEALLKREIDAIIIDYPAALGLVSRTPNLTMVGEPFTQEFYGIAAKKNATQLLSKVNETILRLKNEGKIDELVKKWFVE
jgi:DNA polymerase-1